MTTVSQAAKENDRTISDALKSRAETDSVLAGALFESYKNNYFKTWGYRSLQEYLRERFSGEEHDRLARMHARSVSRLLREYRLAMEIPIFRAAFDQIPRSKRRLLAQVITPENAEEWIRRTEKLTYRELEDLVVGAERSKRPEERVLTKRLIFQPEQRVAYEQAMAVAMKLIERDGQDPQVAESVCMEMIFQEFVATYGTVDGFKAFTTAECSACSEFSALRREPDRDRSDRGGKMIAFQCGRCLTPLALVQTKSQEEVP